MKTNETLTRKLALKWWSDLPFDSSNNVSKKAYYDCYKANVYTLAKNYTELTGGEIQHIWAVETNRIENVVFTPNFSTQEEKLETVKQKFNQKQYKQFDESLFKAYIDKFSDEDKIKVLNVLVCNISTVDTKFNSLLNQISNYK